MKKSLPFFVLLCIGCSNLFSQINVYKPFPQVSGQWILEDWYNIMSGGQYKWEKYEVSGDSIIGSYTYKKVSRAINTGYPSYPNGVPFGPSSFNFLYRNDIPNKKVYRNLGVNHDTLWYDFNLNVGDTIKNNFSNNSYNTSIVYEKIIQSIDSVLICGNYYKKFIYCSGYNEGNLIEGIGFSSNFIHTYPSECPPFEPPELFYTTFSTCTTVGINESNSLKKLIQIYPNPVTTELKIKDSQAFCNYSIVNTIGKLILKGSYSDKESINVASLPNGLYVLELHDKQGNVYQSKFIKQ